MFNAHSLLAELPQPPTHLATDSREVRAGGVFFAYPGQQHDGRDYINDAINAGAGAVFWESDNYHWTHAEQAVHHRPIADLKQKIGYFAHEFYQHPSEQIKIIAVTGTNGKSSIVHLTAQLLATANPNIATIGTLGMGVWHTPTAGDMTTPDAIRLQHQLRDWVDNNRAVAVVMEASSHGIAEGRINGLVIDTALFANAQTDHLDYHASLEEYWQCKARLFAVPSIQHAILNADDQFCVQLSEKLSPRLAVLSYGKNGDGLKLLSIDQSNQPHQPDNEQPFIIETDGCMGRQQFTLNLPGLHNVSNFLAAALIAHVHGISAEQIAQTAPHLTLPNGRMQQVAGGADLPKVYVDFAHTPDAMAAVLQSVANKSGKTWVVFGCGGNRDSSKRQQMGAVAKQWADHIIITDDNPRDEPADAIRQEILQTAPNAQNIGDRATAIATAIHNARRGDVVLILGKGHETTQIIKGQHRPFSDVTIAQQALSKSHVS